MSQIPLEKRLFDGVKNMLQKRGESDFAEVETKPGKALRTEKTLVYLPQILDDAIVKVKNETVHSMFYLAQQLEIEHIILLHDAIAPQALAILANHKVLEIELFKHKFLLFDPTVNIRTPPHELMTDDEIEVELKGIRLVDLPYISSTDRIVRFYNWKVDSVLRIKRPEGVAYRLIVR